MMRKSTLQPKSNVGFAMIEVLITILLMAIGLLGMAGLMSTSLLATKNSSNYSIASQLLQDMADRIRANPSPWDPALANGTDPTFYTQTCSYTATDLNRLTMPNTTCVIAGNAQGCSPQQLALSDLGNWIYQVRTTLPEGQVEIGPAYDKTTGNAIGGSHIGPIQITIYWTERTGRATTNATQISANGTSSCLTTAQKQANSGLVTTLRTETSVSRALSMQVTP